MFDYVQIHIEMDSGAMRRPSARHALFAGLLCGSIGCAALPAGRPNIREILWNSMQLRDADVRMMEGKLSIRGELFLFILYESEDAQEPVQYYDWEIPFDNELECADSRENLIGNISVTLGNHQAVIKPDEDGEPRNVVS